MKCKVLMVVKRDGTVEPFCIAKLRGVLSAAMRTCGYDPRLADPLAKAVEVHLKDWSDARPPSTDYIFSCVRSVLDQTSLVDVARELNRARRDRDQRRRSVRIVENATIARNSRPWKKSDIVATLERRYDVSRGVARFLASRVEQQVFALRYKFLSHTLVGELVRNEMLAWGLHEPVRTASPAGGEAKSWRIEDE